MRRRSHGLNGILYLLGSLLEIFAIILLLPVIVIFAYNEDIQDLNLLFAFIIPSAISLITGAILRFVFRKTTLSICQSMITCTLSWLTISAFGALPFYIGIDASYLNSYFETMSGFTTTGITVFMHLDMMPKSILFWRALIQWVGGLGILSFFIVVIVEGASSAHKLFSAETHKISSKRPAPSIFHTIRILWFIYGLFTLIIILLLDRAGMSLFDAICHSLTTLSTGGFSPYDESIAYYHNIGHQHYIMIEYILILGMVIGGINFFVHYQVLTGKIKKIWENIETKYFWYIILIFIGLVGFDHIINTDCYMNLVAIESVNEFVIRIEEIFRTILFQVVAILTTTGFSTQNIGSSFFPTLSKQLFLLMMVIGGCVGSTSGGIKVLRIVILYKLIKKELIKVVVPSKAVNPLVIENKIIDNDEINKTAALFFLWLFLLMIGGGITALFSSQSVLASFSGMFSALGNIGPCYISIPDMIKIHPVVKITYILGMLAGRLEILPVLLLFTPRAWK